MQNPIPNASSSGGLSGDAAAHKPRLEDLALAGGDVNPLKSDPELQVLLKRLDGIKKYKKFQGWKAKFLARLEQFLYQSGMTPAQAASNAFDTQLNNLVKRANKVQDHIEKGELSDQRKTVKAALNLSEMCNSLTTVVTELEHWIPYNATQEKRRKFTKFHLGAVLIREGFHQYITMTAINDALKFIGSELQSVADRQQHELFAQYKKDVQRFCDVMADLQLYEVMLKCIEFAEEPEDESEDPEPINITIKSHDGRVLRLELEPSENIANIKDSIADGCEIAPDRQIIKWKGVVLDDSTKTLEQLGVPDGAVLTVEPQRIPVQVKLWDGRVLEEMIVPTDSLETIKEQLAEPSGLAAENQQLGMNGIPLGDDQQSAEFYGIKEGSVIELSPKSITVQVATPDGTVVPVELVAQDGMDDMKQKIAAATDLAAPRQVLRYNGRKLPEDATVTGLGLENGSLLQVDVHRIPVKVNLLDGSQLKVMVEPIETIADIKKKLEQDSGLPFANQELILNGEPLADDSKTANDYGIKANTELNLEPKSFAVQCKMPDGSVHSVTISPKDTSDDMKAKIEAATGMEAPRQVLKVRGKELPQDGTTAHDMGLQNGSTINVEVKKVPVTVTDLDGNRIKVMVDPTAKLRDIKVQLEKDSGIPTDNQRLFLDGNELDDDQTAADCGIRAGSELDLEPRRIDVTVEMPDGSSHAVHVSPRDTAAEIKDKIAAATGMAAPRQVLKVGGKQLPDGRSAKDMGLRDATTIKVEVFKVPVTVNDMEGNLIKVMVDPTAPLRDIKVQVEKKSGVPASNQRLYLDGNELDDDDKSAAEYGILAGSELDMEPKSVSVTVETPDGKTHEIEVSPHDTSNDIKRTIEVASGMVAPRQVLKIDSKELPNNKAAKDMGVRDGSTIKVEVFKVPVTVNTMDGSQIQIMVDPTAKLRDLKVQVEKTSRVPASNQNLFLNGKELKDDNMSAADHGIKAGSELDMEPKTIGITVETPDGKEFAVDIAPGDTGEQMKAKVEAVTGIEAPRQVLKFDGKPISAGKTAKEVGIYDGSKLKVEIFRVPVTVNTMDGQQIKVMVDPTDKISAIKNQLVTESGIPANNQNLFQKGKLLADDSNSAGMYGIKAGSELDLEPKSVQVDFVLPDGSSQAIPVGLSDKSDKMKQKVEHASGLVPLRQVLSFNGKELPSEKMAKDAGIREGSSINVALYKIPVTVKIIRDGNELSLEVEPTETIESVQKTLEQMTGLVPKKQSLKFEKDELEGRKTVSACGIKKNSTLTLEPKIDAIIFVDIKCGTLFAMDRDDVVAKQALTPNQGNKLDFLEASTDAASKEKVGEKLKLSPTLGVATQVVTVETEVDDYDMQEAEKVKSMWGVNLKKREKNKAGEEFIFVDSKSGACGELSRKKYIEMGFITPKQGPKGEYLEEQENETMVYEKYISDLRKIFGVKLVK